MVDLSDPSLRSEVAAKLPRKFLRSLLAEEAPVLLMVVGGSCFGGVAWHVGVVAPRPRQHELHHEGAAHG